jgi:D-alanine-D-alanine ligase
LGRLALAGGERVSGDRPETRGTAGTGPRSVPPRDPGPVAVLLGGPSAEHDVSVVSGSAVADALEDDGTAVERVVIDLDGAWWWLPAGLRGGRPATDYDDPVALGAEGPFAVGAAVDRLASAVPERLAFIALHGPFGEDGTVQGLLEAAGICYTGSGVAASALGMDKALFKRLAAGLGLPVAAWREVRAEAWARSPGIVLGELEAFAASNGDPRLVVKPARLGSSVGITIAHGADERGLALEEAFHHDTLALVERYVAGARELEVSVLGNDPARLEVYGPGEILSGHEFYDYAAKYTPGLSETSGHAELPPPLRAAIQKLARDAYRAIGAEGFARVDFLLAGDEPIVSEINTIPGFTPISLFPRMPADGGYDFTAVCRRVIALARERCASRVRTTLRPEDLPR